MLCGRTRETQHEYFNIDAEPVARADSRRQFAARGSAHTFEIKMAAHRPKEDILVHYDEEAGELIFYTVPTASTGSLRANSFGGVRPAVSDLQALEPTEAIYRVGGSVLALLDLSSTEKLGITKEFIPRAIDDDL